MNAVTAYFEKKEHEWENLCLHCGGCCGAHDDPCLHLKEEEGGKFHCEIYLKRFGLRCTIGGEKFNCVPIKEILDTHWKKNYLCPYRRHVKK